jgi:hypothetical protein
LEYLYIDGRIILELNLDTGQEGVDWIQLAQDRDHFQALLCMAMYFLIPQNAGEFDLLSNF